MISTILLLTGLFACNPTTGYSGKSGPSALKIFSVTEGRYVMSEKVIKSEAEWKKFLTPAQFHILREKGTERAFSGKLLNVHGRGVFRCAGCGLDLFSSDDKFESGTGWPSFTKPIAKENVTLKSDNSFFMKRTEVLCARCDGHLGHVFDDGPQPTGQRYCMNSDAMTFAELKAAK
jgi:peptide-methionine (R)-S-oxide reductase